MTNPEPDTPLVGDSVLIAVGTTEQLDGLRERPSPLTLCAAPPTLGHHTGVICTRERSTRGGLQRGRHVGYSGKKAAEIVGITYRQLDYWARTDLVRPSLADANGSGTRRRYSYRDLLELKVVKSLLDAGIRLELVREVFSYLRDQLGE